MNKKSFILPYILITNGFDTQIQTLYDFKANDFVFLNTSFGYDLAKFHNLKVLQLPQAINIQRYNNKIDNTAIHYLQFNFTFDKCKFFNISFILFDLENHKLIFKQTFFAHFNIAIDIVQRQLLWSENLKPHYFAIYTKDLF